jgi:host factor-I protein
VVEPDRSAAMQDEFFHRARREGGVVTIFLTNGKKLTGRIRGVDRFTVVLESHRVEQLIFKHAISTVCLGRPGQDGKPHGADEAHSHRTADGDSHPPAEGETEHAAHGAHGEENG